MGFIIFLDNGRSGEEGGVRSLLHRQGFHRLGGNSREMRGEVLRG